MTQDEKHSREVLRDQREATKPETAPTPPPDAADAMIREGELLSKIGKILKPLPVESRRRIIRAAMAFYGIELEG